MFNITFFALFRNYKFDVVEFLALLLDLETKEINFSENKTRKTMLQKIKEYFCFIMFPEFITPK